MTPRDAYLPAWARMRRMATFERIAGNAEAYRELSKLARCIREEMTEPGPMVSDAELRRARREP